MLATANNNEGQQQRIADDSVITQYGVPGGGGQGLRQSQRQSSWSSLLCCVRPPGEDFRAVLAVDSVVTWVPQDHAAAVRRQSVVPAQGGA